LFSDAAVGAGAGAGFAGSGALRCEAWSRWFAAAIVMAIIAAPFFLSRRTN
jgi:hypothetical protein